MVRKSPYPGVPGTSSELWAECGSPPVFYEDYISQSKYPSQPEMPLWSKSSEGWSGAGFNAPWEKDEYWHSKKTHYFPPPIYSPGITDEEVQRILKLVGLPNTAPSKNVPAATDPAPAGAPSDTDPIAHAIAEYYRDRAA